MKNYLIILLIFAAFSLNALEKFGDKFLDQNKYGWKNKDKYTRIREDKLARQKLLQIYDLKKQKIVDNVLKSTVCPGWGQMTAKYYAKGQILIGTEIFLIGSFLYYNDKYLTELDNYENASYIADIEHYYDKANEYYATSRAIIGLGIAVWIFSICDAVVSTTNYNQDIWESLYQDYQRKKIVFSPTGITLRF